MTATQSRRTAPWQPSAVQRSRDAYRRSRRRRSALVALISSAVVVGATVFAIGRSSGWPATRDSFFDVRVGWHDLPALLRALWLNVQIMLVTEVGVLIFGGVLAIMRTLRGPVFFPLRFLAATYTDIFRGVPLLVVLLLIAFGIPSLRLQGAPTSGFVLCVIALTLTYSAYVAEVFRAGIESVHPSQSASARALGLTYAQTMRFVVLPQAIRRVLPPLLNDFVSLQKDTSLVSTVGIIDVVLTASNLQSKDFKFVHLVTVGVIFLALTVPLTRFTDWIARRQGWVSTSMIV